MKDMQVGTPMLRNLDPFLMLDELKCPAKEAAAGFPDHPHRGFETCSIMLQGRMEHKDSAGNSVRLRLLHRLISSSAGYRCDAQDHRHGCADTLQSCSFQVVFVVVVKRFEMLGRVMKRMGQPMAGQHGKHGRTVLPMTSF